VMQCITCAALETVRALRFPGSFDGWSRATACSNLDVIAGRARLIAGPTYVGTPQAPGSGRTGPHRAGVTAGS
jgi:hypothetical protein